MTGKSPEQDPMGMSAVLAFLDQQKRERQAKLEQSEQSRDIIPAQELKNLAEIRRKIREYKKIDRLNRESLSTNLQKKLTSQETILRVFKYLFDNLDTWQYIFTSGDSGIYDDDSFYFVTKSGVSLRVKLASLEEDNGLDHSVQPFMDKIFYNKWSGGKKERIEKPKLGFTVEEYLTEKFYALQDSPDAGSTDHQSEIIRYTAPDGSLDFSPASKVWHHHNGHEVNYILWDKNNPHHEETLFPEQTTKDFPMRNKILQMFYSKMEEEYGE